MSGQRSVNEFTWKIGGEAGFGIMASGTMFAKTCLRAGLEVFDYSEYPSLIRGGHNTYQVYVSPGVARSWRRTVNILVALNLETIDRHLDELSDRAVIIYDSSHISFKNFKPPKSSRWQWLAVPLTSLTIDHGGASFMRNVVAIGASFGLLSVNFAFPAKVVSELFADKGQATVDINLKLLRLGYDHVTAEQSQRCAWDLDPVPVKTKTLFVTGNEALGLGALLGGCRFYAAYPMTPSSSLLAFLAEHGPAAGMLVRHAEDEIAVINETIGAGYAGVRAMCGTAGGGFALMTEAVGLAGMAEVGIVIVEAQRGGPSTGLPTWTEQGDFRQVLHASQGDFLKVVLAPGDVQECVEFTQVALNLAEQLQTPVIMMTDKYLAESHAALPVPLPLIDMNRGQVASASALTRGSEFARYNPNAKNGVAPRTIPGTRGGLFVANSDEHNPVGYSDESAENRIAMADRRAQKYALAARLVPSPVWTGPKRPAVTLVSWGSSKGIVLDALSILRERYHILAGHLHLTSLNPLPVSVLQRVLHPDTVSIMIEGNQSGQVEGWIRQETGRTFTHHIRQYDGRPFEAARLAETIHRQLS